MVKLVGAFRLKQAIPCGPQVAPVPYPTRFDAPERYENVAACELRVAEASTRVGADWVLLSPDGRLPDTGPRARTQLRNVTDGTTVQLDEVSP